MKRFHAAALLLASLALGSALALADDPGPDTLRVDHRGGGATIYLGVLLAEEASPIAGQLLFEAHTMIEAPGAPDPCATPRTRATRAKPCFTIPTTAEVLLPDDGGPLTLANCGWRKRDYLAESGTSIDVYCD